MGVSARVCVGVYECRARIGGHAQRLAPPLTAPMYWYPVSTPCAHAPMRLCAHVCAGVRA